MRYSIPVVPLFLLGISAAMAHLLPDAKSTPAVQFGIKLRLYSKSLAEDRPYWVYLPPSYLPNRYAPKRYPVLYLLDGESQFQWASEMTQFMGDSLQIPELIVVGIPNTDRDRDFTPTHDSNNATSGGGERFEKFLGEELAVAVDAKFRTAPYRILAGHSLGGVLVADSLLRQRGVFRAYVGVDPSLWWDNQILIKSANDYKKTNGWSETIFIATARHPHSRVDPTNRIKNASEQFVSTLKRNASPNLRVGYHYFEAEDHGSSRLLGLYHSLRFIFDDYKPANLYALDTPAAITDHFSKISNRLSFEILAPEEYVDTIAWALMRAHEIGRGIECLQLNVENYPNSAGAYRSLAEAYEINGKKESAIQNFKKALALNSKTAGAREGLKRLK